MLSVLTMLEASSVLHEDAARIADDQSCPARVDPSSCSSEEKVRIWKIYEQFSYF